MERGASPVFNMKTLVCIAIAFLMLGIVLKEPDTEVDPAMVEAFAAVLTACEKQGKLEMCLKRLENGQ